MIVQHAFEVNNMITTSAATQLLDTSIEDVTNKKKCIVSKIDSVASLMKEVEYEEKAAEEAKNEAANSHSEIMLKVYELTDMQQRVNEQNIMLASEAYVQKKLLSTKMEGLQLHVASLSGKGDKYLQLLDEMSKSLEMSLTSAITKKNLAIKKKKETEAFARVALAFQETRMRKVEEESKRLRQEAAEISRLQGYIVERDHLIAMLHGEISDKCQDVKRLKEELDQMFPQGGKMPLGRKSSISTSSSYSLITCQPPHEPADGDMLFKKDSGDFSDDHVRSADHKQMKSVSEFSEADIKSPHEAANITRGIKKVKTKGKRYGYQMETKGKLWARQFFVKCTKKVKIKGKLHEYQRFARSVKKVNIKGELHGNEMFAKSIKKVNIKRKLRRNGMFAKGIKKVNIKCQLHGNQVCAKSIKKLNLKCKRHGSEMCATIKKLKIKGKRHGSQMHARSFKKLKIKVKQHESHMCAKSLNKVKKNGKLHGSQLCPKRIKKVKIKGLRVA